MKGKSSAESRGGDSAKNLRGAMNVNGVNLLDMPPADYAALLEKNIAKYLALGKSPTEARLLSKIDGMEEFWEKYNYPFLEQAFQRGDNVRVLSNKDYFKKATDEVGSFYKRELIAIEDGWNGNQSLLRKYGYTYDSDTFSYIKN